MGGEGEDRLSDPILQVGLSFMWILHGRFLTFEEEVSSPGVRRSVETGLASDVLVQQCNFETHV